MKKSFYALVAGLFIPASAFAQVVVDQAGQSGLPRGSGASLTNTVKNIMLWLLGIFGFLAVIAFVIAGIWYLMSAGDETRMERGKNAMIYAIIGVIVGLIGLIVVIAVDAWLRGGSTF